LLAENTQKISAKETKKLHPQRNGSDCLLLFSDCKKIYKQENLLPVLRKNRQIAGIIHQRNLRNETKKHHPQTDGSNCLLLLIALQENVQAIINQAIVDCPAIRNHKQLLAIL
jgi:hypothetical protein